MNNILPACPVECWNPRPFQVFPWSVRVCELVLEVVSDGSVCFWILLDTSIDRPDSIRIFIFVRGFAVADVNYGGSTGYGRAYRDHLKGKWGIVDVEDCVNAALFLTMEGKVDGERLVISGGSAGGYVTLCALTFHEIFAAGASYYGVADAAILTKHTHKFEERYLDSLIGPYPEKESVYRERSPIFHTNRLSSPVILFQGLKDEIVHPEQSAILANALHEKGLPYAYLTFEDEPHGFRRAETIHECLDAELYFYSKILGFELPAGTPNIDIINLG